MRIGFREKYVENESGFNNGTPVKPSLRNSELPNHQGVYLATTRSLPEAGIAFPRPNSAPALPWRKCSKQSMDALSSNRPAHHAVPWWLWWNLLSIDAPTVALLWAAVFARASGATLSGGDASALVLAVWVIYASDRILDGWTVKDQANLRERHLFSGRHRCSLAGLIVAGSIGILWLTTERLPPAEVSAGVKLGVVVTLYLAAIHVRRGRIATFLPKELAVGMLFAAGVTLPLWSEFPNFSWGACIPWAFFGLLCALNCLLIECWENQVNLVGGNQRPDPFVYWAASRINYIAAALSIAALAACFLRKPYEFSRSDCSAVCLSALLLLLLNRGSNRFSPRALRALADAALIVPALIALVVHS